VPAAPKACVVVFPGTNGDLDAQNALRRAGWQAERVFHTDPMEGFSLYVLPGGFSYGDYLRPGAVAARSPALATVRRQLPKGALVLGICNGFQILLEAGLLPGALLFNEPPGFRSRYVTVQPARAIGPFGRALGEVPLRLPVAHQAGRVWLPTAVKDRVLRGRQVLATYAPGENPNGSMDDVAGLTDESGQVAGLMPHPERASHPLLPSADGLAFLARLREEVLGLAG
jgi:phosphoribosylformylglycinamidine synthase I